MDACEMGLYVRRLEGEREREWGWRQKHSLITDWLSRAVPGCHLCSLLATWPDPLFPIVEYAVISSWTASLASVLLASFTFCWVSDISWYSAYTCLCSMSPFMSQLYPPYHPHKSVSSPTSSFWWLGALSVSAFVGWVWGNGLRANEKMRKKCKTLGKNAFGCAPWSSVKVRRLPYSALPQSTKQVNHITVDLGTVFLCQQM